MFLMGELLVQMLMGMMYFLEVVLRRLEDDFIVVDISYGGYFGMGQMQIRWKFLVIFEFVEFCQDVFLFLQLNYFDMVVIEEVIVFCEQKVEDGGVMFCNIFVFYKLLMSEIIGVQGIVIVGQRNFLLQVSVVFLKVFIFFIFSFMFWKFG